MQKTGGPSLIWSYRSRVEDTADGSEAWPELCQQNQARQPSRKNARSAGSTSQALCVLSSPKPNNARALDETEYPLLGEQAFCRARLVPEKFNNYSARAEPIPAAVSRFDDPLKRWRLCRRRKRSDKIYINLEDALRSTMCMKKLNVKHPPVTKPDHAARIVCASKKKPSKLKRVILTHRHARAMRIRETAEAIAREVNAISLKTVKIIADPEIDLDYVRGLSNINFYGVEHRTPISEAIAEEPVCHRPDLVDKLNDLHIQSSRLAQCKYRAIDRAGGSGDQSLVTVDNDEILQRMLSLGIDDDDKRGIKACAIEDSKPVLKHSRNFREVESEPGKVTLRDLAASAAALRQRAEQGEVPTSLLLRFERGPEARGPAEGEVRRHRCRHRESGTAGRARRAGAQINRRLHAAERGLLFWTIQAKIRILHARRGLCGGHWPGELQWYGDYFQKCPDGVGTREERLSKVIRRSSAADRHRENQLRRLFDVREHCHSHAIPLPYPVQDGDGEVTIAARLTPHHRVFQL